jgi:hypothetical protein
MRNGIYLTELELERVSSKGIAAIDNDIIRGFDDRYFYFVGRLVRVEYPRPKRRGIVARAIQQQIPGDNLWRKDVFAPRRGRWRLKH